LIETLKTLDDKRMWKKLGLKTNVYWDCILSSNLMLFIIFQGHWNHQLISCLVLERIIVVVAHLYICWCNV